MATRVHLGCSPHPWFQYLQSNTRVNIGGTEFAIPFRDNSNISLASDKKKTFEEFSPFAGPLDGLLRGKLATAGRGSGSLGRCVIEEDFLRSITWKRSAKANLERLGAFRLAIYDRLLESSHTTSIAAEP